MFQKKGSIRKFIISGVEIKMICDDHRILTTQGLIDHYTSLANHMMRHYEKEIFETRKAPERMVLPVIEGEHLTQWIPVG